MRISKVTKEAIQEAKEDCTSTQEAFLLYRKAEQWAAEVIVAKPQSRAAKDAQLLLTKIAAIVMKNQIARVNRLNAFDAARFHHLATHLADMSTRHTRVA